VVIYLEQGADLHMAQLTPLPLTVSCFRLVLPFWYRPTRVVPEKGPLNGCVCTHKMAVVYRDHRLRDVTSPHALIDRAVMAACDVVQPVRVRGVRRRAVADRAVLRCPSSGPRRSISVVVSPRRSRSVTVDQPDRPSSHHSRRQVTHLRTPVGRR